MNVIQLKLVRTEEWRFKLVYLKINCYLKTNYNIFRTRVNYTLNVHVFITETLVEKRFIKIVQPPPFFRRARKYLNLNHFMRNNINKYRALRDMDLSISHTPFTLHTLKRDPSNKELKIAN